MTEPLSTTLTPELVALLAKERLVLLATVDETGAPNVSAISWVHAPDARRVRFAVANRSRIVENVRKNSRVALAVFAQESILSIAGEARIVQETMEGVPLKLTLVEVAVSEVRDVMFYGAKIAVEPRYEKTYNPQAAAKLDQQVLEAMKKA
ncbi:MAG TPA: pyridoxamine 5'-phosphate oxidase family protein [Calditerricola sp.]